jgi:hypothetical protein
MAQLIAGSTVDGRRILDTNDIAAITSGSTKGLVSLLYPSRDGSLRDIHRGGWNLPLNQQWGGHLTALPDGSWGDTATGNITSNTSLNVLGAGGTAYGRQAQGFKVSKAIGVSSIFLRIVKIGNPTDNVVVTIETDNGGVPSGTLVTNATSGAVAGTTISSNTIYHTYEFTFATPPSLSANTQYHCVVSRSGTCDTSNYYSVAAYTLASIYPHGTNSTQATGSGAWSATATMDLWFLIKSTSGTSFLQTGGQFDCKLQGTNNPLPVNQADYLWRPMREFFDAQEGVILVRGAGWTKNATIADFIYGLNHDRIVMRCNATTGYPQVDLYESDGTKSTVTGTTDISAAGHKDVAIAYRLKNDGADYLKLYVQGVSEGTPLTSQSFGMDVNFKELGTAYLLGGFGLAPVMTQTLNMSVLPSAEGWTYNSTATEAAHFVVSGGKLYQQIVGDTDTAYYTKSGLSLSNSNGWAVLVKTRKLKGSDTTTAAEAGFIVRDGAKAVSVFIHTYYAEVSYDAGSTCPHKIQCDLTTREHVFLATGKGSDFYLYIDGILVIDGTGMMTGATTDNQIFFGDLQAGAGVKAEAVWDYLAYYNTAAILPEFTGGSLSEFAAWSGDQTDLLPALYGGGTPVSVKEYCGVPGNYVRRVFRGTSKKGVTSSPTISSMSFLPIVDCDAFAFFEGIEVTVEDSVYADAVRTVDLAIAIDGNAGAIPSDEGIRLTLSNTLTTPILLSRRKNALFGLHKIEYKGCSTAGTVTFGGGAKGRAFFYREVE